jgi:hypothetical protein
MSTRVAVVHRSILNSVPLLAAVSAVAAFALAVPFIGPMLARQQWTVLLPIITATVIAGAFLFSLRRIGPISYLEIGVVYTGVVYLYGIYAPLRYVLNGYSYAPWTEARILACDPSPGQLARVTWWYVLYLLCFCAAYLLVRPRVEVTRVVVKKTPDLAMFVVIAVLLAAIRVLMAGLGLVYDIHATSYIEEYAVIQRLPHLVRQIVSWYLGSEQTLQMLFVLALLCHYRRTRWLLFAILGAWTVMKLSQTGGRANLFFLFVAVATSYALLVRRLRLRTVLLAAVAGLVASLVLGVLRSDREAAMDPAGVTHSNTEFEVIFGNAVDLAYLQHAERAFVGHPTLYLADIAAVVPQQFVPFLKTSAAEWYAGTYYTIYYNAGGGLAFGVVSESIVGHGWPDLIWRGALIGLLLALLQRRMMRNPVPFWFLLVYVWTTVWCYQTVRNTTFGLLMPFLQRVIVPFIAVEILTVLLRVRTRRALLPFLHETSAA